MHSVVEYRKFRESQYRGVIAYEYISGISPFSNAGFIERKEKGAFYR